MSEDAAHRRPRLIGEVADIRGAVRATLHAHGRAQETKESGVFGSTRNTLLAQPLALVALSGGADSLALAAATAFEAHSMGVRAGAVIVDHNLQEGSAGVAARAADQARGLGLDPVTVVCVRVEDGPASRTGGMEAAARRARYEALNSAAKGSGCTLVLLAHTLNDQAETVLLGLARGSGNTSISGMPERTTLSAMGFAPATDGHAPTDPGEVVFVRPLLHIKRAATRAACEFAGLQPWDDPQNTDPKFLRVRVRSRILPQLEQELGAGVLEALGRTADIAAEESEALDQLVEELAEDICEHSPGGVAVSVAALAANPAALRHRIIRFVARSEFGASLSRDQTLEVARLVTDWRGQKPLNLPGFDAARDGKLLRFTARS